MIEWIIFTDFEPMSCDLRTGINDLDKVAKDACEILHGWTDYEVQSGIFHVKEMCAQYVTFKMEEIEHIIASRSDLITDSIPIDTVVCFFATNSYYEWPLDLDVDEFTVMALLGEYTILDYIINSDTYPKEEWESNEVFQLYTKKSLFACLTLLSVRSYQYCLEYPDYKFESGPIPYHQATDQQKINGFKEATTHALRATELLASAKLEQRKESRITDLKTRRSRPATNPMIDDLLTRMKHKPCRKHRQVPDRNKIASNAAKARDAKRYGPQRKFIFDHYHKGSYQSVDEAVVALAGPLRDFCNKEGIGYLSPSREKRTIADWLNLHIKNCTICNQP